VHTPTNNAEKEEKDVFYEQVQKVLDKIPKHDSDPYGGLECKGWGSTRW